MVSKKRYTTQQIRNIIINTARKYGVDPSFVLAIAHHESGFNPNAKSNAGAMGVMQLMPETAKGLGVKDPYNPIQNIEGGVRYIKQQLDRFGGDKRKALAAYNSGPSNVVKYKGIPPFKETQNYVRSILASEPKFKNVAANAGETTGAASQLRGQQHNMVSNNKNKQLEGQVSNTSTGDSENNISMLDRLLDANNKAYRTNLMKIQEPNALQQQALIQNMIDNHFDVESVQRALMGNVDFGTLALMLPQGADIPWQPAMDALAGKASMAGPDGLRPKTPLSRGEQIRQDYNDIAEQNYQDTIAMLDKLNNPEVEQARRATENKMLQDRYNQFYKQAEEMAAQDPRLQNRGYQLPTNIERRTAAAEARALRGAGTMPTPEDIALMQYKTQIANQYGVPYEQAAQALQDGYNMKLALFENQINVQLRQDLSNAKNRQDIQQAYINAEIARSNARKAAYDAQLKEFDTQRADRQQLYNTGIPTMQQGMNTLSNTNLTTGVDLTNSYLDRINQGQIEANKLRSAEDIARLQAETRLEEQARQFADLTYQMGGAAKYLEGTAAISGYNPLVGAQSINQSRYANSIYPTGEVIINPGAANAANVNNQTGDLRVPQVTFGLLNRRDNNQ